MSTEDFKKKLEAAGLEKHFDTLKPLLRNCIRLYQTPSDEEDIAVGATKIGGRPDLPEGIAWPTEITTIVQQKKKWLFITSREEHTTTKPLSFIAQINLQEVSPLDLEILLPDTGMLYFFYTAEQDAWGFEGADKDRFKVIFYDGDPGKLARRGFPEDLPDHARFKPCAVEARHEASAPSYDHAVYEEFSGEETDKFWEEVNKDGNINKLLGYADVIQNEMELECELVTNGLYCGDTSGYNDPRAIALEPNAKDWLLLLQIDSNDENEMMWGDCGRIYFWIKKDDLFNKDFDKSWLILQCT